MCAVALVAGISACGESGGPAAPEVAQFSITPADPAVIVNGSVQFEARGTDGAAVPVYWRVTNPLLGTIDADGLYMASCGGLGTTQIMGLAKADTTRVAATTLTQLVPLHSIVSLVSLRDAATQAPARIDSIAGQITARVSMGGPGLRCETVEEGWLELSGGSDTVVLDHALFPAGTEELQHDFQWDTTQRPNGTYQLRARMRDSGNQEHVTPSFPVVIRNP
jgi:hypothetical protein